MDGEFDKKMYVCTNTHIQNGLLLDIKDGSFAILTTWIDLEGVILSEISQAKTNTI